MSTPHLARGALWDPPVRDVKLVQCGVGWSAVRVPESVAELVLFFLGDSTGAVIHDPFTRCAYWLVPLGSADGWELPAVHVLGKSSWVAVPPGDWVGVPGLRWARSTSVGLVTDADQLRDALASAVACTKAVSSL
ncbi:hypothetical protein [Streptomyces albidus (ex Kaewkla and Franco 2022)]|uniref:hypothetical protein n=1 Tax=Streptomyces albidus (ex Kaewkla and Franco 2022) TaxID=722709 RepID=UPI00281557F0|nr:hypothetical protein [Streptomyces albidus (ex Kaewkla and Franco 2022)]